nr:putative ribonuclease H-like domain-containing protein [Tanacetum cinerariifolium]
MTDVKLVLDLHTTNIDQLHAYLGQHEFHANEYGSPYQSYQYSSNQSSTPLSITHPSNDYQSSVHHNAYSPPSSLLQIAYAPTVNQHQQTHEFPSLDSGLTVPVFKQGDDPIDFINHMMPFISAVVTSRYPTINNQLRYSSNPRQQATINDGRIMLQPVQGRQFSFASGISRTYTPETSKSNYGKQRTVICYNCKGEGHMSKQCTKPKRKRDDSWFKEKVLLVQTRPNGQILHEEELAFLADPRIVEVALMENLSNYGSNALAEVHNHDNVDTNLINQAVQVMSSSEQSNVVNHSETEITSDSNIILYSQYVRESQQPAAQNSNSSAQQEALMLSVNMLLYKTGIDTILDSCAQSVEIDILKQTLLEHLKEKESLLQTVTLLKNNFKKQESRNIDREIALEKRIKQLDNIIFKKDQSAQTVHMLTNPQFFYDHTTKQALGFQNLFYLKKAQLLKPKLYDGNVIEKTSVIVFPDSEETLMLAEESHSKMFIKQKDPIMLEKKVNITPLDYVVFNQLSQDFKERFVPQTALSAEQAFWSQNSMNSFDPTPSNRPTKVKVPKELPKVGMVNTSLKKLKPYLAGFDVVIKERTTATAIIEGTWGFKHTKAYFKDEIIPFAVEQHRLVSKTFKVKMNKDLNKNERLLKQVISKDIVNIIVNSFVDNTSVYVHECEKYLKLETELLNKKDFIEKETYDKMFRRFTTLEKHCISLEVDSQLNQETFQQDTSVSNESALSFDHYFELNKLKAQSQEKDTIISKLKERIKSLSGHMKEDKIKKELEEIETINIELDHREKVLVITALKDALRKIKGKALDDDVVTSHSIDPEMLHIDVEPLNPILLNNRSAHSDYLKHTHKEAAILREIVEQGKSQNPLNAYLDSALRNACPLTRITTTTEVPSRKPIGVETDTPKPVVTLVYSRKPRISNSTEPVSKSKKPHKPKSEDTNQEKLYLLHMDLCGPMRVASINGKKYILVIVDDYSRFTWVKCLSSKDEGPDFIIKFLKMIQVRLRVHVRRIRTDNGTEFVNQTLRECYEQVVMSHKTSVARSPQQNSVVESRNRTLIEAARIMLICAKAPLFLWAEAVATTCYTQNHSIVRLCHGKKPYELLHDKLPDLSFFHVFGALCYPTNDSENLGKLQPKADIGIFIGYAP